MMRMHWRMTQDDVDDKDDNVDTSCPTDESITDCSRIHGWAKGIHSGLGCQRQILQEKCSRGTFAVLLCCHGYSFLLNLHVSLSMVTSGCRVATSRCQSDSEASVMKFVMLCLIVCVWLCLCVQLKTRNGCEYLIQYDTESIICDWHKVIQDTIKQLVTQHTPQK